jgi:hypothetical protein
MLQILGNIIPPWKLHLVLKMLTQSPRLAWSFAIGWLMAPLTSSTSASSTSSAWLKIWRHVNAVVLYQSSVSSKVVMGVMNTSKACEVIEIKIISWPINIWCGARGKLVDKNSKGSIIRFSIINEGLTCLAYSLIDLSLPFTSSLVTMLT